MNNRHSMDYESYMTYLKRYNEAVRLYSEKNNIDRLDVVQLLAKGELKLKEVEENA